MIFILDAVEATARDTRDRILRIRELMEQIRLTVQAKAPGVYSKDLVELIFQNPYCKIAFLEQAGLAKRQTASSYLKTLERLGVLQSFKRGREVYYVNLPLMALLTA